jgi:hypothetical protein
VAASLEVCTKPNLKGTVTRPLEEDAPAPEICNGGHLAGFGLILKRRKDAKEVRVPKARIAVTDGPWFLSIRKSLGGMRCEKKNFRIVRLTLHKLSSSNRNPVCHRWRPPLRVCDA